METMFRGDEKGGERRGCRTDSAGELLAVLHDAADRLPDAETCDEVAAVLVDGATRFPGVDGAVSSIRDPETDALRPVARGGDEPAICEPLARQWDSDAESISTAGDGAEADDDEGRRPTSGRGGPELRTIDDGDDPRTAVVVPLGGHGVVVACTDGTGGFDEPLVAVLGTLGITARSTLDRIGRKRALDARDRRLRDRRVQVETYADLYALVGDVTAAALRQSTREEIERLVCERVAAIDAFDAAWIASLDRTGDGIAVRTAAGAVERVDDLEADAVESPSAGPTGHALRTQEPQLVDIDPEDPSSDEWTRWAVRHDFRVAVAVPVVYEGTLYGVLSLCSTRDTAFEALDRTVFAGLGEVVGHALAAIERTAALTSDDLIELELRLPGMMDAVLGDGGMDGRVEIDRTVPTEDGSFLQFATATPDAGDDFETLLSALPHVEGFDPVIERSDEIRYRIEQSDPPLMSIVADEGGLVRGSVIEDGNFDMYVDLPQGADVRTIVETLRAEYPGVELVAQRRTIHREDPRHAARDALSDELTDRQRAVLEVAYYAGFFEWPRDTTAEELAETMAVSSPTLHHHLRKALGKVLAAVFERGPADRDVLT